MLALKTSPQGPYRIERRAAERAPLEGSMMAEIIGASGHISIASVELVDESHTGLGIASPIEMAPGTTIALYPMGCGIPMLSGEIVRTRRRPGGGYLIGIRCEQRLAA